MAGLWLDASVWSDVVGQLDDTGHRGVPITLPGQGDGNTSATLDDQVAAVVAAVDASEGKSIVVGHSAASTLAWLAADARPDNVSAAVMIGGFPSGGGTIYADFFPIEEGAMRFPGWEPFAGPDSDDLDAAAKAAIAARAIPVPDGVAHGTVRLTDERRYGVPVVLVCPEFSPDDARGWIDGGDVPELKKASHVELVDIDSGHWPMITAPAELARLLAITADDLSA